MRTFAKQAYQEVKRRVEKSAQSQGKPVGRMLFDAAMDVGSNIPIVAPVVNTIKTVGKSILNFFGLTSGVTYHLGVDGKMRSVCRRGQLQATGDCAAGQILMKIAVSVGPAGSRTRAMSLLFEKFSVLAYNLTITPSASMTSTGVLGFFYVPDVESKELDEMTTDQVLATAPSRVGYKAVNIRDRAVVSFSIPKTNYYIHDLDHVERFVSPGSIYVVAVTAVDSTHLPIVEQHVAYSFSGAAAPEIGHVLNASSVCVEWSPPQLAGAIYTHPVDADGRAFEALSNANPAILDSLNAAGTPVSSESHFIVPAGYRFTMTSIIKNYATATGWAVGHLGLFRVNDMNATTAMPSNTTTIAGTWLDSSGTEGQAVGFDLNTSEDTHFLLHLCGSDDNPVDVASENKDMEPFNVILVSCKDSSFRQETMSVIEGKMRRMGQRRGGSPCVEVKSATKPKALVPAEDFVQVASAVPQPLRSSSISTIRGARPKMRAGVELVGVEPNPGPRGRSQKKSREKRKYQLDAGKREFENSRRPKRGQSDLVGLFPLDEDDATAPKCGRWLKVRPSKPLPPLPSSQRLPTLPTVAQLLPVPRGKNVRFHYKTVEPYEDPALFFGPRVHPVPSAPPLSEVGVGPPSPAPPRLPPAIPPRSALIKMALPRIPIKPPIRPSRAPSALPPLPEKTKVVVLEKVKTPAPIRLCRICNKNSAPDGVTSCFSCRWAELCTEDGLRVSDDEPCKVQDQLGVGAGPVEMKVLNDIQKVVGVISEQLKVDCGNAYPTQVVHGEMRCCENLVRASQQCRNCHRPVTTPPFWLRVRYPLVPWSKYVVCPRCPWELSMQLATGGQPVGYRSPTVFRNQEPKKGLFAWTKSKIDQGARIFTRWVTSSPFPAPAGLHVWRSVDEVTDGPVVDRKDENNEEAVDYRQTSSLASKLRRPFDHAFQRFIVESRYDNYSKCSFSSVAVHRVLASDLLARFGLRKPTRADFDAAYDVAIKPLNVNIYAHPDLREVTYMYVSDFIASQLNVRALHGLDFQQ